MRTIGYVVPLDGLSAVQLKSLMIRFGEWIWAEEKHGIGILFDIDALARVRDGKVPKRFEMVDDREVPVVRFNTFPLGEDEPAAGAREAFLLRAREFFDPLLVSAVVLAEEE